MKICHLLQIPESEKAYKAIFEAKQEDKLKVIRIYDSWMDPGNGKQFPLYTYSDGWRILFKCEVCGAYILEHLDEYHDFSRPAGDEDTELYVACGGEDDAEDINRNFSGIKGIMTLNRRCLEVLFKEEDGWNNPQAQYCSSGE